MEIACVIKCHCHFLFAKPSSVLSYEEPFQAKKSMISITYSIQSHCFLTLHSFPFINFEWMHMVINEIVGVIFISFQLSTFFICTINFNSQSNYFQLGNLFAYSIVNSSVIICYFGSSIWYWNVCLIFHIVTIRFHFHLVKIFAIIYSSLQQKLWQ